MSKFVKAVGEQKRDRILDAGLKLSLALGVRGTTMEALAQEAGIAKPTLYSYFPDKHAVYAAIVQRLFNDLEGLVAAALSGKGSVNERVAKALGDKYCFAYSLLDGSPHAEEICGEKGRFAAEEVERFENWLETEIAGALARGGHTQAPKMARILIGCSQGISRRTSGVSQIAADIRLVVEKLLV